jgi:hypothetical protein
VDRSVYGGDGGGDSVSSNDVSISGV